MSTFGGIRHSPSTFTSSPASTTLFRRLVWEGTVPLEIRVDSKELPANSNRGLECYFLQAPRVSYLPLLIPEIKRFLQDVVFDDEAARTMKEEDWWFESEEGHLLKWHWPIGLIYDNHTTLATSRPGASASSRPQAVPLRLTLHLASPPTDRLLLAPSAEACKQAFMGQLKEADFLRWGNTKRMTGLRKAEQDGMWEGIKEHNFDDYWRVASKVTPTTLPARPGSPPAAQSSSMHTRPPSADPQGAPDRDSAYIVRSVPIRLYLPEGPVLQDLAPPVLEDGTPNTLADLLSLHLPLLFPAPGPGASPTLAYALLQGVVTPAEAELAWLGACMSGADGWVNICIGLGRDR
ncbi:autophagy protein Apg5-domain-containing protein [Lactarius hengduanensis]|nr:autophagy protein Apg5-domain-containing protein [Lactarius hengduanensis]